MRIPIDHDSEQPLYQQIEGYLRQGIGAGSIAAGTRLPATRLLAQGLGVSRITVESAYAALEADGLIERRLGSGTYVLAPTAAPRHPARAEWPLWQGAFAELPPATPAAPRAHPGTIRFMGFGDPRRFPAEPFARALRDVLREDGSAALVLEDPQGYAPLRATVAQVLSSQGIQAQPEQVLITTGSQQALALAVQLLLRPGDTVLVEQPSYDGALDLFRAHRIAMVGCPIDEHGMRTELLEPLLQQHHPRMIYTIPNFQNPSGACLSLARRRELIALADRYNIPILEDDFVGDLRYEGRTLPALKALDPGGRVIYAGTFSKLLMPGLRVGFLVAEGPVFGALAKLKRVGDLATSGLIQRALDRYVTVGSYHAHIRRSCQVYRRRRDALVQAVGRALPGARASAPHGGLFVWVQLPMGLSTSALLPLAIEQGVEFAPGPRFFPSPADGEPFMRLNFATQGLEEIDEGIRRLGAAAAQLRGVARPR